MYHEIHAESLRLIASTASTLRRLELLCGVFELPLDLPCLPVLRALELRIFLGFSGSGLPPHLYPRRRGLAHNGSHDRGPLPHVLRRTPDEEDWGPDRTGPLPLFDDACAYRAKLPSLRRVHCHGQPDGSVDQEDYAFYVFILERFPGLRGTGVLEISAGGDEGPP
ncbi:hypothetical protein B0H14DRAFT_3479289 [Mycena olivaceomarginata]|nr:hypothetical protein B0H14DRAFT_3479289 [Mycena olivaceomarginata]